MVGSESDILLANGAATFHHTADEATQKERVREFFNHDERWKGRIYLDTDNRFHNAIMRRMHYVFDMLDQLPESAKGDALDIGCGSGEYIEGLLHRGWNTSGIDLAPEMVKVCAERFRSSLVSLKQGDVESLPFDAGTFDLILCIGVLPYLPSDEQALREIHRVLRPGGYVVINVENMMSASNIDYVLRRSLQTMVRKPSREKKESLFSRTSMVSPWVLTHSPTHYRYRMYNPWRFEDLVRQFGFSRINAMTFGYEFRWIRRLRIAPESLLIGLERFLETSLRRIPLLAYYGEAYTGVFQKAWR
jgi:ubiquinone/menaquinone biosynthesis C-methylase UbiE